MIRMNTSWVLQFLGEAIQKITSPAPNIVN